MNQGLKVANAETHHKPGRLQTGHPATMQFAEVNGIKIAYAVRGSGPPLFLIMGYRLSSLAWPSNFIEALAERFTVVLFDNRGTGASDKPTIGYEISNMARDVSGLMDHLGIPCANILGYSMGGAIAQEFVRQFPDRVSGLVLCATMSGGPRAVYASPSVVQVMRELDGLKPEEIARRIWNITYAPGYLKKHRDLAEVQMQREITAPTPLHAADLQFQAFAEFDCSKTLASIRAPTLVLTGDLDQLVSPRNSRFISSLIPRARLIVIPNCGHRLMWEATDECVAFITEFLTRASEVSGIPASATVPQTQNPLTDLVDFFLPATELIANWPWMLAGAGVDSMTIARQSIYSGGKAQFGDGKPIVLVPQLASDLPYFLLLSNWLKVLGYRPVTADFSTAMDDQRAVNLISGMTQRIGRKAVLVATGPGTTSASKIAEAHKDKVSDIVILDASHQPNMPYDIRAHFISSGLSPILAMASLPQVLRNIRIELIEKPDSGLQDSDHRGAAQPVIASAPFSEREPR